MGNISYTENGLPIETNKDFYKETFTEDTNIHAENTSKPLIKKNLKPKKGILAMLGAGLAILSKFKFLLVFLKLGKISTTLISMFVMIWLYAATFGWAFGVGFVALLFAHEMGHYIMARRLDIDVSAPLFIPFVGAVISMKQAPKDAVTEAKKTIVLLTPPPSSSSSLSLCLCRYLCCCSVSPLYPLSFVLSSSTTVGVSASSNDFSM